MEYRKPLRIRPLSLRDGERAYLVPKTLLAQRDEAVLAMMLCCDRHLFGWCYRGLVGEFFDQMPRGSGVMITGNIPIEQILPGTKFPGDIDMLVIPYDGQDLVLSRVLVVEVKAVRASYARQGKSPNEFGFSQAVALSDCGFPYVAVAHLISADESPRDSWRDVLMVRVVDADSGRCEELGPTQADMLPGDLIQRSYGRLLANSSSDTLGLLAAYVSMGREVWRPQARLAQRRTDISATLMDAIERYYHSNVYRFLDTSRYPQNPINV